MITRMEIVQRGQTVWILGTVPYSQVKVHQPDGYRQDCSGYVSMCWALPDSENTVSLVTEQIMFEIKPEQADAGDAFGLCGEGTAGDAGHIMLVTAKTAGGWWILEQAGGRLGPTRRFITQLPDGYKAYRYVGLADQEVSGMSYTVRSGGPDNSIYLVPGGITGKGLIGAYAVYGAHLEAYKGLPQIQLPGGLTVEGTGIYDTKPGPITGGAGPAKLIGTFTAEPSKE